MSARHRPWGADGTFDTSSSKRMTDSTADSHSREPSDDIEHKAARRRPPAILALRARLPSLIMIAAVCVLVYIVYAFAPGSEAARLQWEKNPQWQVSWYVLRLCRVVNGQSFVS
jgi:hypothetical protein